MTLFPYTTLFRSNSYDILVNYGVGTKKNKLLLPFHKLIKFFINHKNPFKAKNIIIFDKWTEGKIMKKKKYKNTNVYLLPIFHVFFNTEIDNVLSNKKGGGCFFIGRISDKQKNIKYLNKIPRNIQIDVFGIGPDEKLLKSKNIHKRGFVSDNQKINIFKNNKVMIMTSRYEGSPISLIEALSFGIPLILLDTFPFARYIANNKGCVLLKKKTKPKKFEKYIEKILNLDEKEYQNMQLSCFQFYEQNLSNKIAEKEWKKIIEKFEKN